MAVELTNMVMVYDPVCDRILVEHRRKSWRGITFPGGHVEKGENFYDSAVREIKEETGLDVYNLKSCGTFHWCREGTGERYLIFLYKTSDYSGELLEGTDEGEVFWVKREELPALELSSNFADYLPMFFEDQYSEAFRMFDKWDEEVRTPIIYK